jgi:hypothetical protein
MGKFDPEGIYRPRNDIYSDYQRRTIIVRLAEKDRTDEALPLDLNAAAAKFEQLERQDPDKLRSLVANLDEFSEKVK